MALVNKITVFGLDSILAYIVLEPIYIDGKECIVLDYSKTSCVAHWVSVEIPLISPGLYLGRGFWKGKSLIFCYAVILSRHAMRWTPLRVAGGGRAKFGMLQPLNFARSDCPLQCTIVDQKVLRKGSSGHEYLANRTTKKSIHSEHVM